MLNIKIYLLANAIAIVYYTKARTFDGRQNSHAFFVMAKSRRP